MSHLGTGLLDPGAGGGREGLASTARPGQAEPLLPQANQFKVWPSLFELVRAQVGIPAYQCLLYRRAEPNRNGAFRVCAKYPAACSASSVGPALCMSPSHSSLLRDSLLPVLLEAGCHRPVAQVHRFPAGPGTQTSQPRSALWAAGPAPAPPPRRSLTSAPGPQLLTLLPPP